MRWILLLSSIAMVPCLSATPDSIEHFFWLPLDTSIALPAPAIEVRDSTGIYIVDVAYGKGELSDPRRRHYVRFIGTRAKTMEYFSTEFGEIVFLPSFQIRRIFFPVSSTPYVVCVSGDAVVPSFHHVLPMEKRDGLLMVSALTKLSSLILNFSSLTHDHKHCAL